ncbi:histidine kinase [Lampropedia cohaerens]|uniref:histidine kinase n=1 Tax=Lampropedia cohaerens TaxID=1610491 RepID=A0A0U1Q0G3_9BURK|nr:HAMP domain-containing sensor histidine kinase [Lampropedia cohaerens]KKW68095.1 histidine kinase [Lampropedia cohaerens]
MKRRSRRSIGSRITWTLAVLMCAAVSLTAAVSFQVYRNVEEAMIVRLIQSEFDRIASRFSRFGKGWQQPLERNMGPSMFAWGESARYPVPSVPDEVRILPNGLHRIPYEGSTWFVQAGDVMDGRLYVVYDSGVLKQQTHHFAMALLAIVLVFSCLAIVASAIVARWLVNPLKLLSERLDRWAPGKPSDTTIRNEADRLMDAFSRVQDQVDAAIADQREFSANLHHEIRTPLTIIQSDAELLLRRIGAADTAAAERLRRISASVKDITQALEATYSLTHAETTPPELLSLHECVNDAVQSLQAQADAAELAIVNAVDARHVQTLARHALMTVTRNILRNAILHAAPARLVIVSIPQGLQFTDSGPGIDAEELPHIFERYFSKRRSDARGSASPGLDRTGLGLAIASRVCATQGWQLGVQSPVENGRGTRFTLRFGPHQPKGGPPV